MVDNNEIMPLSFKPSIWQSAFMSRWVASQLPLEDIEQQSIERMAKSLLLNGFTLIPSEHLHDKQCVVSRRVYTEAVRILQEDKDGK